MKFIAKKDDKELIVDEKMFKPSNLSKLVNLLNKSGFSLGSGHDGMEMKKINDDYEFILIPYIGHPVQHVLFTKINDKMETLFDDLISIYTEINQNLFQSDSLLNQCIEKKTYEMIKTLLTESDSYVKFIKELKYVLQKHFRTEIKKEIIRFEKEYEEQRKLSDSIWNDSGSELAGDFNKGEKNGFEKIKFI